MNRHLYILFILMKIVSVSEGEEAKADDSNVCQLEYDEGSKCSDFVRRYYYNSLFGQCLVFKYGGCLGNGNNFGSLGECEQRCKEPGHSRCANITCSICHLCDPLTGRCVPDVRAQACEPVHLDNDSCQNFVCPECHDCKENKLGQAKCVYRESCCSQNETRVNCFVSPCDIVETKSGRCPQMEHCLANYCNGCKAVLYDQFWNEVCPNVVCGDTVCRSDETCSRSLDCPQPPCPQYSCQKNGPCATAPCPIGTKCVADPKQCIRSPCPQYACISTTTIYRNETVSISADLKRCSQLADSGPCKGLFRRWHYNRVKGDCVQFTYGGCRGNENNFVSEQECRSVCGRIPLCVGPRPGCPVFLDPTTFCPVPKPTCDKGCAGPLQCPPGHQCQLTQQKPRCVLIVNDRLRRCSLIPDPGECKSAVSRYHYSRMYGRCLAFSYGGCGGNENRFETIDECESACDKTPTCPVLKETAPPRACHYVGLELNQDFCPKRKIVCDALDNVCSAATCPVGTVCLPLSPSEINCSHSAFPCVRHRCQSISITPVTDPCKDVQCLPGQICQPKICTNGEPCLPSYTCVFDRCATVRCPKKCIVENGEAICVDPEEETGRAKLFQCSQIPESGPCEALSERWHYSRIHASCKKFYYGGCQGNGNNFLSKQECEERCRGVIRCPMYTIRLNPGCQLQGEVLDPTTFCPQPKIVCNDVCQNVQCASGQICRPLKRYCKQPPCNQYECVENPCNLVDCRGSCKVVNYSAVCIDRESLERCSELPESGHCQAAITQWHYNRQTGRCHQFTYSGCGGNRNRFDKRDECEESCAGVQPCPQTASGCSRGEQVLDAHLCPQSDIVCNGDVVDECSCEQGQTCKKVGNESVCVDEEAADARTLICSGLADTGPCRAAMPRWYFDRIDQVCKQFIYGGCHGNENNFNTREDCQARCFGVKPCRLVKVVAPAAGCQYIGKKLDSQLCPLPKLVCNNLPSSTDCNWPCPSGFSCKYINGRPHCQHSHCTLPCPVGYKCQMDNGRRLACIPETAISQINAKQDVKISKCSPLPDSGPCYALMKRWYYDRRYNNCHQFDYGGCQGNENNFLSADECLRACSGVEPCRLVHPVGTVAEGCRHEGLRLVQNCPLPKLVCDEDRACAALNCPGGQCRVSQSQGPVCVPVIDICRLAKSVGPCEALIPSFFYNNITGRCEQFNYGGCNGNENRFETKAKCEQVCVQQIPVNGGGYSRQH